VNARPAVFLDRDGVLNELVADPLSGFMESPLKIQDVCLVAGAAQAARALLAAGFPLICVSNQPAAAKGRVGLAQLLGVHRRVAELLAQEGVRLADSRLCPHHPEGVVPALSGACRCRKPAPGMLLNAAAMLDIDLSRSWMVGDTDADLAAGRAAGCRTLLIEHAGSAHKRLRAFKPDLQACDLISGVPLLL
jgi:D-glycero-D-manno-heptose 1,7-bisphosphate phosphatase